MCYNCHLLSNVARLTVSGYVSVGYILGVVDALLLLLLMMILMMMMMMMLHIHRTFDDITEYYLSLTIRIQYRYIHKC